MLFGAHVSSAGGISKAIDRAEELGCEAVQIFTQSPRMWRPTAHAEDEVERFRARRDEVGIQSVVCHALYLVNLAAPDREIHKKSVAAMRASLATAAQIGAEGVVFHVGSHLDAGMAKGLKRAVPPLRELLELTDDRLWLVLENSAGAGGTIGRSVAELAAIFDGLAGHPRLGICLDSCHWWVSGVDVTDRAALDDALGELDGRSGSTGSAACMSTTPTRPSGRTATATRRSRRARSATGWRTSLLIPRSRASRRSSRPRARRATPAS